MIFPYAWGAWRILSQPAEKRITMWEQDLVDVEFWIVETFGPMTQHNATTLWSLLWVNGT